MGVLTMKTSSQLEMPEVTSQMPAGGSADPLTRIADAFKHLRQEMKEIQRQDIFLLRQLMYIRHSIFLISRHGDRRSYSIGALGPPAQEVNSQPDFLSPFGHRPLLSRVQSAPLESRVSEETIPEEDEDEEEDEFSQSFNSAATGGQFSPSLSKDSMVTLNSRWLSPDTDFVYTFGPLPPVFKRILASSDLKTLVPECMLSDQSHPSTESTTSLQNVDSQSANELDNEKSLLKAITKRQMLKRQRSVEEVDSVEDPVDLNAFQN